MLSYVILCYLMLSYVILCYLMLSYVILCYLMLSYVILCYLHRRKHKLESAIRDTTWVINSEELQELKGNKLTSSIRMSMVRSKLHECSLPVNKRYVEGCAAVKSVCVHYRQTVKFH